MSKIEHVVITLPIKDKYEPMALCIGNFDGVHLGHLSLVNKCLEIAKSKNIKSAFFTLNPNPRKIFNKDRAYQLTSIEDRKQIASELGFDIFLEVRFDEKMINLTPEQFVDEVLKPLNVKEIVCGKDYTFAKYGKGNVETLELLKENLYNVNIVDDVIVENEKVSTTRIMKLLSEGNIKLANKLLGRNYFVSGEVIKGYGNGKKIGFPTANVETMDYFLPKNGVYAVNIYIDGEKHLGMANIGLHPTIDELEKPLLEAYIFQFEKNIYDQKIKVEFLEFIRDEKKFENLDDLKKRIKLDTFLIFELILKN